MDKLTLLLGILIGVVVVLYFIPVWRDLARSDSGYEGFTSSSSSASRAIGSSSSSSGSLLSVPIIGSSSSSATVAQTTPSAPTCPSPPNIEDAVSKAISDALGRMGGGGGSGTVRNKKTMNFGAAAGTGGLGMPMQSPPLDMQKLIEMAKALVDPSITVDSDSVRTKFTYKYGSANSLTPTQLADVYLIYLEYPNFYYNFYSILDQSNKDVFRKSYLSEQSQAISMINTFGMEVMIYLHQQLDPNFEADFGDQYEEGGGEDDMTGTCKTDKALIEELKKCLTSSDVNCVQKVLNKYSETNIINITNRDNTTTNPPPTNQNMGSSSSYQYTPEPTVPVGSSSSYKYTPGPTVPIGSSSSYGLLIPPSSTTTDSAGKTTGTTTGGSAGKTTGTTTGGSAGEEECGDEDIEVIVNMAPPPAPAPATASVSSCPVCDGGGCNTCSGTGSPSLGQGTNWKYITPQVSKCKTEEPIDMRWGY